MLTCITQLQNPCDCGNSQLSQKLITDKNHVNKSYSSVQAYYNNLSQYAYQNLRERKHETLGSSNQLFIDYVVRDNDTLLGIALDYNISPELLKSDNEFSSDLIYTGQTLRIRLRGKPGSSTASKSGSVKSEDLDKDLEIDSLDQNLRQEKLHKRTPEYRSSILTLSPENSEKGISVCISSNGASLIDLNQVNIYYCTSIGDTEGNLILHPTGIEFHPTKNQREASFRDGSSSTNEISKKLETWVNYWDIADCQILKLPSLIFERDEKDYVLQLTLYNHGDKYMGKYLDQVLKNLQNKKTPYACVYFKLRLEWDDFQLVVTDTYKEELANKLKEEILSKMKAITCDLKVNNFPTKLPYFEFLYKSFKKEDSLLLERIINKLTTKQLQDMKEERKIKRHYSHQREQYIDTENLSNASNLFPRLSPKMHYNLSHVLNDSQLTEVIRNVPSLYQGLEWKMVYSNVVNGNSYQNMLRKLEHKSPVILIIRDSNDFVFGAYTSDHIKLSNEYYGNGETFLFTFRDLEEISVFRWTKKNSMFVFSNEEGTMFGAQPHYGLWVSSDLTRGRTFECETFENSLLALSTEFSIFRLEVWTIVDPFSSCSK